MWQTLLKWVHQKTAVKNCTTDMDNKDINKVEESKAFYTKL